MTDGMDFQGERVSERCRRTGQQNCHECEDLKCGDNLTQAAETRRLQILRRAVRKFLDQYEEHINAAIPLKEVIICVGDLNDLQEAIVGIEPKEAPLPIGAKG